MRIDLTRYSNDKVCATPEGLRERLLADLLPRVEAMDLQRNRCLVASYVKPNITPGGIIIPAKTGEEDRWQGKVGLLIKTGPSAFHFDEVVAYAEADGSSYEAARIEFGLPREGDWVAYRTSETHEIGIEVEAGVYASCRIIHDDSVIMRLDDPRAIY
jgi:hypothetical protein